MKPEWFIKYAEKMFEYEQPNIIISTSTSCNINMLHDATNSQLCAETFRGAQRSKVSHGTKSAATEIKINCLNNRLITSVILKHFLRRSDDSKQQV